MANLTKDDWVQIHAKAWKDSKFRYLLETDPTAAVKAWASETHRTIDKIVDLSNWVKKDEFDWDQGPPSCC
jgi:hypothetical protein